MPTYEYVCDGCSHQFEEFQSIKDDPLTKCPSCGKKKLRRLIGGGAALLFKGSGFYITDYRSEGYQQKASADKPAAASSGDSGASGSSNGSSGSSSSSGSSGGSSSGGSTSSASSK